MILLNALLKSASDCHQGDRLICPAELIRQLDAQVKVVQWASSRRHRLTANAAEEEQ